MIFVCRRCIYVVCVHYFANDITIWKGKCVCTINENEQHVFCQIVIHAIIPIIRIYIRVPATLNVARTWEYEKEDSTQF